jgi:photosystem II stability/assembly factor-like uncharacterized protein
MASSGLVSCLADSGANLYAGTNAGLFLSTNHGGSWTTRDDGLTAAYVFALAVSATSQFAGTDGDGVFLSTNNGTSWKAIKTGLTARVVHAFAVSGTNTFASIDSSVYLTQNDGITWKHLFSFPSIANALAIIGNNLVAGTGNGIFLSTNDGNTWEMANAGLKDTNVLSFAVSDTDIFAGTNGGGVYLSTDKGNSWIEASTGLTNAPVRALASSGANLFAATSAGVFFSTNNGAKWKSFNTGLSNLEDLSLAVSGPYLLVGTTSSSGVFRRPLSDVVLFGVQAPLQSHNSLACFPNPSSGSIMISLSSSDHGTADVIIVNLLGAEVARLYVGELGAGSHVFNWDAQGLPKGIYVCVVRMNGISERVPMMVAR